MTQTASVKIGCPAPDAPRRRGWLHWGALAWRIGFAGLFLWTSIPKIADPSAFLSSVLSYEVLPVAAARLWATVLPWMELFIAIGLLSGLGIYGCWLAAAMLFGSFAVAQAIALSHGLSIECGCGLGSAPLSLWTVSRSVFLLALVALGALLQIKAARAATHWSATSTVGSGS